MVKKRWILVADTVQAKVYTTPNTEGNPIHLKLEADLEHPEGAKKNQDLVSDRPGHYQTGHSAGGSYGESNPKEVEDDKFARHIACFLEEARNANKVESLIVIAAPHFFGLIEKYLSKSLHALTERVLHKHYTELSIPELEEALARKD